MFSKLEAPPTPSPPRAQRCPRGGSKNGIRAAPIVALRPHPGYLSGDHLARGGQVGEGECPARDAYDTILGHSDSFGQQNLSIRIDFTSSPCLLYGDC